MDRSRLIQRARMLQDIRAFFYQHEVLEVETPALSLAGNTDPSIESFRVLSEEGDRFLQTSPEYPMKRLLAAGSGDIFQICKVWRAQEYGSKHNPEFTMLEWYRVGFNYFQLMKEVEDLLLSLFPVIKHASRFVTYREIFLEVLGIDPHISSELELQQCIREQDLDVEGDLDRSAMLDLLMTHCIESGFAVNNLTFVYDYPAWQKALACLSDDEVPVAQRFEVYFGSMELGNGYQEQTQAELNAEVLQNDLQTRLNRGQQAIPVDRHFLDAMKQGLPRSAGVAIGVDRLLMCQSGEKNIQDVISFPWTVA